MIGTGSQTNTDGTMSRTGCPPASLRRTAPPLFTGDLPTRSSPSPPRRSRLRAPGGRSQVGRRQNIWSEAPTSSTWPSTVMVCRGRPHRCPSQRTSALDLASLDIELVALWVGHGHVVDPSASTCASTVAPSPSSLRHLGIARIWPDCEVEVHPVLHRLRLGNRLEEDPAALAGTGEQVGRVVGVSDRREVRNDSLPSTVVGRRLGGASLSSSCWTRRSGPRARTPARRPRTQHRCGSRSPGRSGCGSPSDRSTPFVQVGLGVVAGFVGTVGQRCRSPHRTGSHQRRVPGREVS